MPIVDLFAGLRNVRATRGATSGGVIGKSVVEISAPDFKVNLNEPELAGAMAIALVEQFRANILGGAKLDGTPAKPLAAATLVRREYRILQGQRGGAAADRYRDKEFKRNAKKNWKKHFKAARAGEFNPATSPHPKNLRAVESGLLLASLAAVPQADGTWKIYVANNRSETDRSGRSALSRALGIEAGNRSIWQKSVAQAPVRKRLQFALKAAVDGKSPLQAVRGPGLFAELQKTAQLTQGIADTATE